jgi:glycosyltransferase involved in cell wall biosynthesis
MIHGKKVVVVMPAYNAARTIEQTYAEVPLEFVDEVILVDDASRDETANVAQKLGIETIIHPENRGYGGNQKTCYREALRHGADVVVMLHPDYQYTPKLLTAMASLVAIGQYDVVLGSRILCGSAWKSDMPRYKYFFNRALTFIQNILLGLKLSEYHTGYRAFSKEVLRALPLEENSDDNRSAHASCGRRRQLPMRRALLRRREGTTFGVRSAGPGAADQPCGGDDAGDGGELGQQCTSVQ